MKTCYWGLLSQSKCVHPLVNRWLKENTEASHRLSTARLDSLLPNLAAIAEEKRLLLAKERHLKKKKDDTKESAVDLTPATSAPDEPVSLSSLLESAGPHAACAVIYVDRSRSFSLETCERIRLLEKSDAEQRIAIMHHAGNRCMSALRRAYASHPPICTVIESLWYVSDFELTKLGALTSGAASSSTAFSPLPEACVELDTYAQWQCVRAISPVIGDSSRSAFRRVGQIRHVSCVFMVSSADMRSLRYHLPVYYTTWSSMNAVPKGLDVLCKSSVAALQAMLGSVELCSDDVVISSLQVLPAGGHALNVSVRFTSKRITVSILCAVNTPESQSWIEVCGTQGSARAYNLCWPLLSSLPDVSGATEIRVRFLPLPKLSDPLPTPNGGAKSGRAPSSSCSSSNIPAAASVSASAAAATSAAASTTTASAAALVATPLPPSSSAEQSTIRPNAALSTESPSAASACDASVASASSAATRIATATTASTNAPAPLNAAGSPSASVATSPINASGTLADADTSLSQESPSSTTLPKDSLSNEASKSANQQRGSEAQPESESAGIVPPDTMLCLPDEELISAPSPAELVHELLEAMRDVSRGLNPTMNVGPQWIQRAVEVQQLTHLILNKL
mmetsp:Transcript_24281/g.60835  ORF Transcript_24281/g.60835 Transcript_24281/m.60835 type:complete len:626 (-) Transcript_24281:32-1909(-)